ncbi:MAG: repeat protein [Labilithrix sp.]|nr:repeat protein [Labilithrix sp.]
MSVTVEDTNAEPPAPAAPAPAPEAVPLRPPFLRTVRQWVHDYFLGDDPTFGLALVPFCFLSMLLFTRHPSTNFIFDEQEALLANPYVRSVADAHPKFRWIDAFYRDFWGLGPDRSIGSYRPIPDLVWRALWALGAREQTPFLHHWVNVLLHGVNGALVTVLAFQLTRKRSTAWLAGLAFTACAVLTEAVSGVVGISDVLGATGAIAALMALAWEMPLMGVGVFAATLFGLYSKESALCCVPLVPVFALLCAQVHHPARPRRWTRAILAFVAVAAAFVFYVEARRRAFPAALPTELSVEANAGKRFGPRTFAAILRWYGQPALPKDPLNNPLVNAPGPLRLGGALRVYFRGLVQLVFPYPLSGDYSAPQEPLPKRLLFPESILGALGFVLPFLFAAWAGLAGFVRWMQHARTPVRVPGEARMGLGAIVMLGGTCLAFARFAPRAAWIYASIAVIAGAGVFVWGWLERRVFAPEPEPELLPGAPYRDVPPAAADVAPFDARPLAGAALLFIAVSYFPVSNIPALLPTIRAERFWYFPAIGSSLLLALGFTALLRRFPAGTRGRKAVVAAVVVFFGFQGAMARRHANDYTDDLTFWDATRKAVPRSAKAHLNYSVMKGARGDLEARLASSRTALELAPEWPMASIYLGDTLCRLHRAPEAWPHYRRGFELAPNDVNLVALALQCLWDEKMLGTESNIRAELDHMKDEHPGSWVQYLANDILDKGEEHNGVDPKYRPRGYNEGPKD